MQQNGLQQITSAQEHSLTYETANIQNIPLHCSDARCSGYDRDTGTSLSGWRMELRDRLI
ncbi:MAG: hypothetical protein OHK0037_06500 [Elainellaceae cyanobacterium]